MKLIQTLSVIFFASFISCTSFGPTKTYENKIAFDLDRVNSESDYSSEVASFLLKNESSTWYGNPEEAINLRKKLEFSITLENGEEIEIGFHMKKDFISVDEFESISEDENGKRDWSFETLDVAIERFYNDLDYLEFTIENSVIFFEKPFDEIDINARVEKEGRETIIVVDLDFDTSVFGWFDPKGQWSEYFDIKNTDIQLVIR